MTHIAKLCRFIKGIFNRVGWKVIVVSNPQYALNGAIHMVIARAGQDFVITVQPIYSTVEVIAEDDQMFKFLADHQNTPDGQGRFN